MLLLATAMPVWATPEEDFREGRRAYFAGDMAGATTLLKKSADVGYAPAQALLARLLRQVDSVNEALEYFRKSAAQGYTEAQFELGAMYATGEGVKRNPVEARRWMIRAAENGHRPAIIVMADAYIKGGLDLDENERTGPAARQWIRSAADNGYVPALEYLARAYRNGTLGLAVDLKQAEILEARAKTMRGTRAAGKGKKRDHD